MLIKINIIETDKDKCPGCTYKGTIEFRTKEYDKKFNLNFDNATELISGDCSSIWKSFKYDTKLPLEAELFLKEKGINQERIDFILPKTVLKGKIGEIEAELDENSYLFPEIIKTDFK